MSSISSRASSTVRGLGHSGGRGDARGSSSGGGGVTFPLPERFFPNLSLTPEEEAEYRFTSNEFVFKTLEQEIEYRHRRKGKLDDLKWKFVKAKDGLKVYKRLQKPLKVAIVGDRSSRHSTSQQPVQPVIPMVLAVGHIPGKLEDQLYGVHHKDTDEMRITTAYVNKNVMDAAVFHTIDTGTDEDPFRYLAVKWRCAQTPGGNLISNRDVICLEYVGRGYDARGEKYGFHMIKSIDAPWFPDLPDPHVVRARMMMCCVYRQVVPGVVDTYIKGVFNLGGELIDVLAYATAADKMLAISKAMVCAEAKRLTLLMILEQQRRLATFRPARAPSKDVIMVDRYATSTTTFDEDESDGDDDQCSLCFKSRSLLAKIGSTWDRCRICLNTACPKCYVRKTVFARPRHIKVPCCKACIMEAKEIHVDPRDPYPVIGNMVHHD